MSSEEVLPCVLFVSCSDDSDLAKLVEVVNSNDNVDDRYVWKINTKYYEASVRLVPVSPDELENLTGEDLGNVGGVVLYYDGNLEKNLERLKSVVEKLSDCDAGVKLLVCDSCDPEGSRVVAEEWCVERGFEHLELEGPEGDESRLKQALEAHVWPNLVHKAASTKNESQRQKKTEKLTESTPSGDLDDDFLTLFQHLATMKEQAAGLPPDERKNFAEQAVLAYWRSIGGDEDELLDV